MKRIISSIFAITLLTASISANAQTWFIGGVLYGNICRNGIYYTVYPVANGQPVGSSCPVRDNFGNVIGYGFVSNE